MIRLPKISVVASAASFAFCTMVSMQFLISAAQAVPPQAASPLSAGKAKLAQGQNAQAIKLLEQAVKAQPTSCEAQLCLGKAYLNTKNYLQARTHLRSAIRVGKGSPNAQMANKYLMSMPANMISPRSGPATRLLATNLGLLMRQRGIGGSQAMPAVLEFYASWCEPCKQLKPLVDKAKTQYGDKVTFMNINVDDPSNEQIMDQYEVSPIPTVIFINKDGEVVSYALGFSGDKPINDGMDKILPSG
jgi:thioredoxin-like negative regulator of GroEL